MIICADACLLRRADLSLWLAREPQPQQLLVGVGAVRVAGRMMATGKLGSMGLLPVATA